MSEQLTFWPAPPRAKGHAMYFASSESDEWYTPFDIVQRVSLAMGGIDLDPCADPGRRVPANRHYTAADDGLSLPWHGRIFMNPPYTGKQISRWVRYLMRELREGQVTEAITLTPARTDTKWFQHLWAASAMCFVAGRVHFDNPDGPGPTSATFPTVLAYFGERPERFKGAFESLGKIIYP